MSRRGRGAVASSRRKPSGGPPTYNVAAPNGTNDTSAIQAALNLAAVGGGIVQLQVGTYLILSALTYGSNTVLRGQPLVAGRPVTTIANLTSRSDLPYTIMLMYKTWATQTNITVERITWDQRADYFDSGGAVNNALCLDLGVTSGAIVQDCDFHNIRTIGIYFDMEGSGVTNSGFIFRRNYCRESNGDFISTFGACVDGLIDSNFGENTKDDCIAVQDKLSGNGPVRITISNNTVLNCGYPQNSQGATANGINIWGGTECVADGNHIQNVYASCIRAGGGLNRGTNHIVRNNVFSGAGWGNNLSQGTPAFGIFYYNVDGLTLTNNIGWNNRQGNHGGYGDPSPNTGIVFTDGTPDVPLSISGLQLWLDPSQVLDGVDGTAVSTLTDYSGNGRHGTQTGTNRPTFRTDRFPCPLPTGLPGFEFDGIDDYVTTGLGALSALATASAYTMFFVVNLDNAVTDNAAVVNNAFVWGDHAVPGIGSYTKATGPTMHALNYDGTADSASVGFTLGVPAVFMQRHEAGNLYIARDGGAEASVASGNTFDLSGALFIGQSADLFYMDGRLGEFVFWNRSLTTAEVLKATNYLILKWKTP